jgi:UPF0176 protein
MRALHNRVDRRELKANIANSEVDRITLSFYKYARIGNVHVFRDHFYLLLSEIDVLGRIYVAHEGVNGQISVPAEKYQELRIALNTITFLENCRLNVAIEDDSTSFFKLAIKIRKKIVADGLNDDSFDVTDGGTHINAEDFNRLTENPETTVVDMRNHYESEVGHFENALTPDVETFREALPIVEEKLKDRKEAPLIMYCTGGIRCEKASAYYKHKGFKDVYQLNGGIIEYTRQVNEKGLKNKFRGKNFVFDERLGERISSDVIAKCHQCGKACDTHVNCANDACHILFLQCEECTIKYDNCCSIKCKDFTQLPEDQRKELRNKIEFNGTKFGKGRYKANRKDEPLKLD